ncbi:DUF488 domain-containing protein [Gelidibacter salicanalis]|uniref:DUF488 domain-containing protein n=1 Tax=Gelidibacter salicanalis TaxID=291193 RepID=A0A5C7AKR4_9FLAO|nr:DUF488 domain-containing protein [Gelidibacter salicanalis]TXE09158.1 DUF488 domain-containing protein [Gelidibacter salicanalis]
MKTIKIKRIYDEPTKSDGYRVLVDRIWPRGISKEDAKLDDWLKEIAPSTPLRKWFDHDPEKFEVFSEKYKLELKDKTEILTALIAQNKTKSINLLYGAKDTVHNQAVVLKEVLENL